MACEFTVENLPARPALGIRRTVRMDQIGTELGVLFGEVFGYAHSSGAGVAGKPFCRYHGCAGDQWDLEAGVPVRTPGVAGGRVAPIELPGGPAAVTIHRGPYDQLHAAHAALEAWLAANGRTPASPRWEEYVIGLGAEPDPQKWETRLCQPIR